uniref:UPAR/Ly6 domain-containing protein n=1 Tax=Panagrolaimus sp. ES5 TaxID=591445 RepID=A0AC34G9V5_9BILA
MKHLTALIIFCSCYNFVNGLKCLQAMGNQPLVNEQCSPTDRFCIRVALNGSLPSMTLPLAFQSCSANPILQQFSPMGIACTGSGKYEKLFMNVKILYSCCDTDNCNSAPFYSIFGATMFVVFATFLQKLC